MPLNKVLPEIEKDSCWWSYKIFKAQKALDDFILIKVDGRLNIYSFAFIVDDWNESHNSVIRGLKYVASTNQNIFLFYEAWDLK